MEVHGPRGEVLLVVRGELFVVDLRLGAGSYFVFGRVCEIRPRPVTGVRLFGFNLLEESVG